MSVILTEPSGEQYGSYCQNAEVALPPDSFGSTQAVGSRVPFHQSRDGCRAAVFVFVADEHPEWAGDFFQYTGRVLASN